MGNPNTTENFTKNQTNSHRALQQQIGLVCSCGFATASSAGVSSVGCPLGFPWSCLRQMLLPFSEPMDRRRSRPDVVRCQGESAED